MLLSASGLSHLVLNQEIAGSNPARSTWSDGYNSSVTAMDEACPRIDSRYHVEYVKFYKVAG